MATSISMSKQRDTNGIVMILPGDDFIAKARKQLHPFRNILSDIFQAKMPKWKPSKALGQEYFNETFQNISPDLHPLFAGSTFNSQLSASVKSGVDVIMPCMRPVPKGFPLSWIGYLSDFQHRHLPEFFSQQECFIRDRDFKNMLHHARHIFVNAKAVASDAELFFDDFPAKLHVLPFSPSPQLSWLESGLDVRAQYRIDKPYFLICNQMWKHKDHATAFKGFAEFISQGGDALLVCTGATHDYRFPEYFSQLSTLITQLGMQDRIKVLGHIPKVDQISLVKNALAMVQATLFEGGPGGGAAFDAIGLGVPVIASDIAVNLEMDCGDVSFFGSGSAPQLAQALRRRGTKPKSRPSNEELLKDGMRRKRRCGQFILDVAAQAAADFKKV